MCCYVCPLQKYKNGETVNVAGDEEREQFLAALRSSIEIFVNRMRSNSQRNRSIANDSSVQTLFMTLSAMHPQLMRHIQDQEDQRSQYTSTTCIYYIISLVDWVPCSKFNSIKLVIFSRCGTVGHPHVFLAVPRPTSGCPCKLYVIWCILIIFECISSTISILIFWSFLRKLLIYLTIF